MKTTAAVLALTLCTLLLTPPAHAEDRCILSGRLAEGIAE
jgi:hypothetical protein